MPPLRKEVYQRKLAIQQKVSAHMVTAVIVLDQRLNVQYVNPAAEALLVRSFNKLFNLNINDVFITHSFEPERLKQLLATGQEFTHTDVELLLFDSHTITVEITASAIELDNSPHVLIEFKQIDQQKKISLEAFQQQQWESGRDLIRGLAHEIKNPLGGLRGAAQLLSMELADDQKEYTAMIIEQADRLRNLVDRLLGPNQLPRIEKLNIHQVLEKVYQVVNYDEKHTLKVLRDYDPSIPDIDIDSDKIQQAVLNIVSNASQAITSQKGTIKLKTRMATSPMINGKRIKSALQISIIDNGPGIPPEIQDTLFYPMVSGRSNGTGLGLSISQTLINQHHGKLSYNSRPGRTEFIILLPISQENDK